MRYFIAKGYTFNLTEKGNRERKKKEKGGKKWRGISECLNTVFIFPIIVKRV